VALAAVLQDPEILGLLISNASAFGETISLKMDS
jgi:hypothetical protein